MLQISRRKLLGGLSAFIAAPAIIKVASIMPVKVWDDWDDIQYGPEFILMRDSSSPASNDILGWALHDAKAHEPLWIQVGQPPTKEDFLRFART